MASSYAFCDINEGQARATKRTFIVDMDADIRKSKEGKMNIRECGMEPTVKKCQMLATHNKHIILGTPT